MERRQFMLKFAGITISPIFASIWTRAAHSMTTSPSTSPPLLELKVQRKESQTACMRGYLLTRVGGGAWEVTCYVLELPVNGNSPVSALAAGAYPVHVRTDGAKGWRLELEHTEPRSHIEVHIGNYPANTVGCLLPGLKATADKCAVLDSAGAMEKLRNLFAVFGESGDTTITIE